MSRRPPRKSSMRRAFETAGWLCWCLLFLVGGTLAGWVGRSQAISHNLPEIMSNLRRPPQEVFGSKGLTILLLGCDEVLTPGGKHVVDKAARADMILLAKLDFAKREITGLSIPRDTRCQLPGDQPHKINAYHKIAKPGEGSALTKTAVEYLLDNSVNIDRVVVIDYSAFMDFIDLLDGVTVTTPIPLYYIDKAGGLYVDIPKGTSTLGGYDAMGFVRIRKDAGDDYARQDRQKQLLVAVKDRVTQNWTRMPQIIDAGAKVFGDSLSPAEVAALASFARSVSKSAIRMGSLPTHAGKGTFLEVDRKKLAKALREYNLTGDASDGGSTEQSASNSAATIRTSANHR